MKRYLKLFTCLCFAVLLLVSFSLMPTAAMDPIDPFNRLDVHSWEELKQLRDASKKSDSAFLSKLSALDEKCDRNDGEHLDFQLANSEEDYRQTFAGYYEEIADLKVLVPKDTDAVRVEIISMRSEGADISGYDVNYVTDYLGKTFRLYTTSEKDCSSIMSSEEGEPIRQVVGDGYTVKIWERKNADLNYQSYRGYFFLEGEDTPSFYVTLTSANWKDDVPEALLSLYGQFRVTTADKVLAKLNLRTWIWVTVAATCAVVIAVIIVVFCKKKKKSA